MSWGQAGGSLRADSAGVWWSSMTYEERIQYMPFIENQNSSNPVGILLLVIGKTKLCLLVRI